jgi:hypothetical protein
MTATRATDLPWSAQIFATDRDIYLMLPGDHFVKLPYTEGGLSKALRLIRPRKAKNGYLKTEPAAKDDVKASVARAVGRLQERRK